MKIPFDYKEVLKRLKAYDYKGLLRRVWKYVRTYDYIGLIRRIIRYDYKQEFKRIKSYDYKGLPKRIKVYDYKALFTRVKSFRYTDPNAYKEFFKDERIRRGVTYAALIIFAIMLIRGCEARLSKRPMPPKPVKTQKVIKKDAPIYLESFGTLRAIEDVDIESQVTGQIKEIHFVEGDLAAEGDLLFTIDPREYKAALDKAKAELQQNMATLKLQQDILKRNRILIEKDLISQQDFETYQTQVKEAQAQVDLSMAELELAKIDLGYCYITSPINGLTGKRQVDPGNIVIANEGPVLLNITTVDPYYLDFTIGEKSLPKVRDAMNKGKLKVEIAPEGDESGPYEGELVFIDNKVDDMTGTVLLRAIVPNKERKLWAGQFVLVRLILSIQKDAVLAPYAAVSIGQKGHYLFVITDKGTADLRYITVGPREGDYIVVQKGVSSGDNAVTTGQLGLAPGVRVMDLTEKDTKKKRFKIFQ